MRVERAQSVVLRKDNKGRSKYCAIFESVTPIDSMKANIKLMQTDASGLIVGTYSKGHLAAMVAVVVGVKYLNGSLFIEMWNRKLIVKLVEFIK
ncbi:hypothetical protein [Burkholderia ubonensis]|uniref:hypothetical protein n=1 Tax=Burkholderia ubonensis TaxID=101571 RepID=UPI0018E0535A|nr:hypothetical protein [Burkholderia ubonensis]